MFGKTVADISLNAIANLGYADCRWLAPVYPGETIRTELWRDDAVVSFRAKVVERDVVAINNGRAELG